VPAPSILRSITVEGQPGSIISDRGAGAGLGRRTGARVVSLLGPDREPLSAAGLRRMVPELTRRDVYMCGSPGLTDAVRRSLRDAGLPPEQLHEERFAF
jgi:hypothetical protein